MQTHMNDSLMFNVAFSNDDIETKKFKERYDAKCLEVLSKFISICEKYDLRYVLGYGSVLGAVRHNGIIPWDDDIDVCMPRPDYEKFQSICKTTNIGDFEIFAINEKEGYLEPYIKFADKNSSLLYSLYSVYVCGVMIDIFPIDGASNEKEQWEKDSKWYNKLHYYQERSLYFNIYYHRYATLSFGIKYYMNKGRRKEILILLLSYFFGKKIHNFLRYLMSRIEAKYNYDSSPYVAFYHRVYGYKERIPKKWIEETIIHKFETINARIPLDYDNYLRHFYGDYHKIPSLEERDKHPIKYINLNMRESLVEIKDKIDKWEKYQIKQH